MKKISVAKKLLIFFGGAILIFGIINLVWLFGIKMKYINMSEDFMTGEEAQKESAKDSYYLIKDGYEYLVAHPTYLGTNGFISVFKEGGYEATIDENGEVIKDNGVCVTLFIWPEVFGYEYGVDIYSEKEQLWEQITIDENGNYIPTNKKNVEYNEYITDLIEEYQAEIQLLLEKSKKQWSMID